MLPLRASALWALRLLCCLVPLASAAAADVYIEEEVAHSGIGPRKTGARKTLRSIYVKGARQRVESRIEASAQVQRQLQAQGRRLKESTILQLDSARVYAIDPIHSLYTRQALPAPKPVAASPDTGLSEPPSQQEPRSESTREIHFRSRVLPDTLRIHGLLCRRVAAEMRARHYEPGTRTLQRENRYLYQAWVAEDFPGYDEIRRFRRLQEQRTSYPSLLDDGMGQVTATLDGGDRLSAEIAQLEGFPMQSQLRVSVKLASGHETPVFALSRRVLSLSYTPLPDSLFRVTADLRREEE